MMLRIRSRDGLERIKIDNPDATIDHLKTLIKFELRVPYTSQILSTNQNLLLAKTLNDVAQFSDMANPKTLLSSLNLAHGSIVYLAYDGERTVAGAPPVNPAASLGRKMTMEDLIAKQMRVGRQENRHCMLVSIDYDSAEAFQSYVMETLGFTVKRGGFMYGTVSREGKVEVDFIYEPPQQGTEDDLILLRDLEEEQKVEAIAMGMGMRRVGFIFSQTPSQDCKNKGYTMSNRELLQAVQLQAEGDLMEWVNVIVMLNDDAEPAEVSVEAFQVRDMCLRLFREGWFETEVEAGADPKLSRMKKDVVVGVKDTREVDNDFFLVTVGIDHQHQGLLTSTFPVENRLVGVTRSDLRNHLQQARNLPYAKRIANFHVLLFLAGFLDVDANVPVLAECVRTQAAASDGHRILIESIAALPDE